MCGELGNVGALEQNESKWEQHELTQELEGDQLFGRIARGIGSFVRRAAPILKNVAHVAAPLVGTATGGPCGAILAPVASQALGEEEFEQHELAHELESPELAHEFEQPEFAQHEFEHPESAHEFAQHEFESRELAHEFEQHEFEQLERSHGLWSLSRRRGTGVPCVVYYRIWFGAQLY